ncbi:hypothetical protein WPS_27170 [Vulcanimicrobium alpinum]|uniref:Right handed beta helix domain-containing protein n=1 Tax=Vulcanimicrobium alpinum TaxID=3016050 RepID=A0AAN1XXX9_UNVUL|nr:hypothetical protein WPS_27170 [Vulcanimicrobium alpinum]
MNVAACTTVNVAAGTYAENVIIAHALVLKGAQAGVDARSTRGAESTINGGAGAAITVNADNVTVDGFTLGGPVSQGSAAIVMMGANSGETIQNTIVNNPGRAASFNTSATIFRQNRVVNGTTSGDGFQANTSPVHDVTLANNAFGGATAAAYNADITIIEGNKNIVVTGNSSTRDGTLVALFKTDGALVSGNTVVGDPSSSAIYVGGADTNVTVSGNVVSGAGSAVNVANAFGDGANLNVRITRNTLKGNVNGVKVGQTAVTGSSVVVANRNILTGNSTAGVNNLSSIQVDATCNWWGAKDGPGPIGPGSGDKVTANVTFSPWLRSTDLDHPCNAQDESEGS